MISSPSGHAETIIFIMISSSGMHKQTYLQWLWALAWKNDSIYNDRIYVDLDIWHAKATVFTMILSYGMQKQQCTDMELWHAKTNVP